MITPPLVTLPTASTKSSFQLVYQTGLFLDDCKAWKRLPTQQKTWTGFKTFFATAHNKWSESQSTTTGAEFHTANLLQEQDTTQLHQQETVNAIDNLATAISSDSTTVATLTATTSTLTSALTACQPQLVEALQNVAKLTTTLVDINKNPSARPPNTRNWHYLWNHGYSSNHSSRVC